MAARLAMGCLALGVGPHLARAEAGPPIPLASDGRPAAVVVLPEEAHRTERFAADELRRYLERISGARLEIVTPGSQASAPGPGLTRLVVGAVPEAFALRDEARRRDRDAFWIKGEWRPGPDGSVAQGIVYLVGAEPRATLFAVYDFLERDLGCRWLGPGDLWEEIPRRATLAAPAGERLEQPGMTYRGDYALESTDWALKHKINIARRLSWPFDWMRFHDDPVLPIEVRGWMGVHEGPRLLQAASRAAPGDTSAWFAVAPGGGRSSDFCFSNPDVQTALAQRLSMLLRARPELDFVELGCDDGLPEKYCRCARCLAWDARDSARNGNARGKHTHRWLMLVNAVAERLAESDPGKRLLAAAYSSYQEPPNPEIVRPAATVIMMYWAWDGCRMHGFDHEAGDLDRHARYRHWIQTWRRLAPGGLIVADYHSRNSMDGVTGVNPRRFVRDLRWLRQQGATGYLAFAPPLPWGMFLVNRYAAAKAAWNPDLDADALVRDFCDHAFHTASGPMQAFITGVEAAMEAAPCSHTSASAWMTPDALAAAHRHLDDAQAAARGDAVAERRLRPFVWHLGYAERAQAAWQRWIPASEARDLAGMRDAIRLGDDALAYRNRMRREYPDEPFPVGSRLERFAGPTGRWQAVVKTVAAGSAPAATGPGGAFPNEE